MYIHACTCTKPSTAYANTEIGGGGCPKDKYTERKEQGKSTPSGERWGGQQLSIILPRC